MNRISLCLIVGNVEEYIERCLRSFAPLADEIILVRAIGSRPPDRTLDIARAMFSPSPLGGERAGVRGEPPQLITADYKNSPDRFVIGDTRIGDPVGGQKFLARDWPHVDSFAAARQMSFDLATGDYCFWCDTDDILGDGSADGPTSAAALALLIREHATRGSYPLYRFPYVIPDQDMRFPRERMILKTAGRWRYPVHETFKFDIEPVPACDDERIFLTHLPKLQKTGSNDRNLRILQSIPEAGMNAGLWYHLHGELLIARDIPAAITAAKHALDHPDIGVPEAYQIYKNLANVTKDNPKVKHAYLLAAYGEDPRRRDALALLASHAMDCGLNEYALSYALQMRATPGPIERQWNAHDSLHTWLGDDIFCQALRCNGQRAEAEKIRLEGFDQRGQPTIALIHATRGRPQQAALARKIWIERAEHPGLIEHVFCIDADDRQSDCLRRFHHVVTHENNCVDAWNSGALISRARIYVQMSDDWDPPQHWDRLIAERFDTAWKAAGQPKEFPRVLAISDGHRTDSLLCMAVCTRDYYMLDWFLFHPAFTGVYSDNYFTKVAYDRGLVIEARDLIFRHGHPAFDPSVKVDSTYQRQNSQARYDEGFAVFQRLTEPDAPDDWSTVPGFFNYWQFYRMIARAVPDGSTLCEVGCWLGRSLIYLAQELQALGKTNCRLLAVDHFRGETNQAEHEATVRQCGGSLRPAFEANLKRCGVSDMVTVIPLESIAAAATVADASLDFCFIDAAHDYESVKRDILAWRPKLKPQTPDPKTQTPPYPRLAGHDADWPQVRRAVTELLPDAKATHCIWFAEV